MSTGAVIAVVVAVLVVIAVVAALVLLRDGAASPGLKRRFGPEYERALARNDGDDKATRRELSERVKRYGGIELRPLPAEARERYTSGWVAVQSRFVDEPAPAVNEADRLIARLAAERGFPGADSPEHFDALSVHHPHQVQGYRHAHLLAEHGPAGRTATEDLRQALLGSRALYDELLRDAGRSGTVPALMRKKAVPEESVAEQEITGAPATATDGSGGPEVIEAGAVGAVGEVGEERRGPLSQRFAALTGSRRNHDDRA